MKNKTQGTIVHDQTRKIIYCNLKMSKRFTKSHSKRMENDQKILVENIFKQTSLESKVQVPNRRVPKSDLSSHVGLASLLAY